MTETERKFQTLYKGIESINVNLIDIAISLRELSGREVPNWKGREKKPRWRLAIKMEGGEVELPDPKKYDWVLVKFRNDVDFLPNLNQEVFELPHIAEYRDGKWWAQEWDAPYGSATVPFEVVWWRPIDE